MSDGFHAATQEQLWHIWRMLLDHLLNYLKTTPSEKLRAGYLELARQFLKDNKIQVDASHQADLVRSLEGLRGMALPFDVPGLGETNEQE